MAEFNDFLSIVLILWLIVGIYNPEKGIFWDAENKSRGKFILYFILVAIGVTVIQIALKPNPSEEQVTTEYSESQRATAVEQDTEIDSSKIRPVTNLISHFSELTDLQQEEWNSNHEWEYVVEGNGKVTEVGETNFMSEDDSFPYEVTVELSDNQRAVIYYPKEKRGYVLGLNKGSDVSFVGRLKNIKDWGFWKTGYIKYIRSKRRGTEDFSEDDAQVLIERLKKRIGAKEFLSAREISYTDGDSGLIFIYRGQDNKLGAAAFNITEENFRAISLPFQSASGISNLSSTGGRNDGLVIYFDYVAKKGNAQTKYFWNLKKESLYYKKVFVNNGEVEYSEEVTDDKSFSKISGIPLSLLK